MQCTILRLLLIFAYFYVQTFYVNQQNSKSISKISRNYDIESAVKMYKILFPKIPIFYQIFTLQNHNLILT